jgi:hypothetical protein
VDGPAGQGDGCGQQRSDVGRVEPDGQLLEQVGVVGQEAGLADQHRDGITSTDPLQDG